MSRKKARGEFIGGKAVVINSVELHDALLEWYSFPNNHEENTAMLDQMSAAIASACRTLNESGWNATRYTNDFVVFTDCTADLLYNAGLRASVPEQWMTTKTDMGMFGWL